MKTKKLVLRDEVVLKLKQMKEILSSYQDEPVFMGKVMAGEETGCGGICKYTCSYYCRPECTATCEVFCKLESELSGPGSVGCVTTNIIWQY